MLKTAIGDALAAAARHGWIMEPDAKRLVSLAGIDVPDFLWAQSLDEAAGFAEKIGYPLVCKLVSPQAIHKSDTGGVALGIASAEELEKTYRRFSAFAGFAGVLVEEMVQGVELIVGATMDFQFGPVILLGMGGTGVEIYNDTALRMAPLGRREADSMPAQLKGRPLLEGYRGTNPINLKELTRLLLAFSGLVVELEGHFASIDLNPVICSDSKCVAADARIILNRPDGGS